MHACLPIAFDLVYLQVSVREVEVVGAGDPAEGVAAVIPGVADTVVPMEAPVEDRLRPAQQLALCSEL